MSDPMEVLARSRALWNRSRLDLESDEVLAQIVDRGSIEDWQALYSLLHREGTEARRLRERVHALLYRAPTARPHFWLAALASLGHVVDWTKEPRKDAGEAAL